MTPEELNAFKDELHQLLRAVSRRSGDIIPGMNDGAENHADPLDRAAAQSERDYAFIKLGRQGLTRANILKALEKIEDGAYGICEACEEAISIKRLKAIPDAPYCLTCQVDIEKTTPFPWTQ